MPTIRTLRKNTIANAMITYDIIQSLKLELLDYGEPIPESLSKAQVALLKITQDLK